MGFQALVWVVIGCVLTLAMMAGSQVFAQQPPLECSAALRETDFKLNAETLLNRTLRDAFARELRVAVERAEKAEQAQAKLQQELKQAQPPVEKKD